MSYGWVIDRDHISGCHERRDADDNCCDRCRIGVIGPSAITDADKATLENGGGVKWRAYDDDGELYYEGRWVGEDDYGLGPLTDFCMPDAGCTRIDLFENGRWSTL